MKRFPLYRNHDVASCFNCGGDMYGEHYMHSGNAKGHGEFMCHCVKCDMWTYYDVVYHRGNVHPDLMPD